MTAAHSGRTRPALAMLGLAFCCALAACGNAPRIESPPATPPVGLLDMLDRPAERALSDGIRAYDDALYTRSEAALRRALSLGLASPRDRANAHKLLAFITCTSERINECEAALLAARAADPGFVLSRSEAGHPVWGPVYRRVLR
jgi:hypothetical protein